MEPEPPWMLFLLGAAGAVAWIVARARGWPRRRQRRRFGMSRLDATSTVLSLGSAGVAAYLALQRWDIGVLAAWLVGINVAAVAWFALDKMASMVSARRVPESTLHTMAALGGSPGALVGMDLFRHKTIEPSFKTTMSRVIFLQIVAVLIYVSLRNA